MTKTPGVKLNLDIVNGRIADRGLRMVGAYVCGKTKATFVCSSGHMWSAQPQAVMSGNGCPHCADRVPLSQDVVNRRVEKRGLFLLHEYRGARTKSQFGCLFGHVWAATPDNIMRGRGCPHCSRRFPLTKGAIDKRIVGRGIVMVGEYVDASTPIRFTCAGGHEWIAAPGHVARGSGCPHCVGRAPLNKDVVNERIAHRGITLLGEYTTTQKNTVFGCSEGHQWSARPGNILQGKGCPYCANHVPLTTKTVNGRLASRALMLAEEYTDNSTPTWFACLFGHSWLAKPSNVMFGTGCPHCHAPGTDANVVYLWKMADCYYNGTPVYKVGITSHRLGDTRIHQVARKHSTGADVIRMVGTPNARDIEAACLEYGQDPKFIGDGCTEMRAFDDWEYATVLGILDRAAQALVDNGEIQAHHYANHTERCHERHPT